MKIDYLIIFLSVIFYQYSLKTYGSCQFGYFQTQTGTCVQCLTSCPTCTSLLQKCQDCSEGFKLNILTGECQPCQPGYLFCQQHNTTICQRHYRLRNGVCVPKCQVQFCQVCSSIFSKKCFQCYSGYRRTEKEGLCVSILANLNSISIVNLQINETKVKKRNEQTRSQQNILPLKTGHIDKADYRLGKGIQLPYIVDISSSNVKPNNQSQIGNNSKMIKKGIQFAIQNVSKNSQSTSVDLNQTLLDTQPLTNTVRNLQKTNTECLFSQYQKDGECHNCDARCLTCINSASQCIECALDRVKLGWKCITIQHILFNFSIEVPNLDPNKIGQSINQFKSSLISFLLPSQYRKQSTSLISLTKVVYEKSTNKIHLSGALDRPKNGSIESIKKQMSEKIDINNIDLGKMKLLSHRLQTVSPMLLITQTQESIISADSTGYGSKRAAIITASVVCALSLAILIGYLICQKSPKIPNTQR